MPSSAKCEPSCQCKKHANRLDLTNEERAQRHRDQSRKSVAKWRRSSSCPSCSGPKAPTSALCQKCRRAEVKANAASPEEIRRRKAEDARKRRASNPKLREEQRERNKAHGRRYHLKSKYGISLERWDEILIAQSGRCYLCEQPLSANQHTHVDHSHTCCPGKKSCGKCIRGLCCMTCNQGIGQFQDDVQRMRLVADNLEAANIALAIALPVQ